MLSELIKSKVPAIYIRTTEESRVSEVIASEAQNISTSSTIIVWNPIETLGYTSDTDEFISLGSSKEPKDFWDYQRIQTLMVQKNIPNSNINIFIFYGVKYYLSHTYYSGSHEVIYKVISLVKKAKEQGDIVIFVGGYYSLPEEIANLFYTHDMLLPDINELSEIFKSVAMEYSSAQDKNILPKLLKRIPKAAQLSLGLTLSEAESAFARSLQLYQDIDFNLLLKHKAAKILQSDVLELVDTSKLSMDDVIGFSAYKQWLELRAKAFDNKSKLPAPKGVIFCGLAGTGKSLMAKTTGSFLNLPVIRFDFSRVFRSLVGDSEALLERTLKLLEVVSPVVVWLDECNLSMAGASSSSVSDSGVSLKLMQMFLTWQQENKKPVFIVATANSLDTLPPMLYRRGRMDQVYFCGLPSREQRKQLFILYALKHGLSLSPQKAGELADQSDNFSGVEVEHVVIDALFYAAQTGDTISKESIEKAIKNIKPNSCFTFDRITKTMELFSEVGVIDADTGLPMKF